MKYEAIFAAFSLLVRNFELTKAPRESFLAAYDFLSGAPDVLTPQKERASISRAVVSREEL